MSSNKKTNMDMDLICEVCKKTFGRKADVKKHIKKFHTEIILPEKRYNFKCAECGKNFSHKKNLNFHLRTRCGKVPCAGSNPPKQIHKKCPMCNFTGNSKEDLCKHFTEIHDIQIERETVEFFSRSDFETWKIETEKNTQSKFIRKGGSITKTKTTYICHRSGRFKSSSQGNRHIKFQGSKKINSFCPASIELTTEGDTKFTAVHTKTHVGHKNELKHLLLTPMEREALACKIAAKVPYDVILQEARESTSDSPLGRMHLLTKKDLYNIKASFQLESVSVDDQNDAASVESCDSNMREDPVLFYKSQGSRMEEYPELKEDDFVFILMNCVQKDVCNSIVSKCIGKTDGKKSHMEHQNDATTVQSWVNEMRETWINEKRKNYVFFYKPQGTRSREYPQLMAEDFVLILMNDAGKDDLSNVLTKCIDGTFRTRDPENSTQMKSLEKAKQEMINKFMTIINTIETKEELETVERVLAPMKSTLELVRQTMSKSHTLHTQIQNTCRKNREP